MSKKNSIEVMGTVIDAQPNAMFKVKLENGFEVLAHVLNHKVIILPLLCHPAEF